MKSTDDGFEVNIMKKVKGVEGMPQLILSGNYEGINLQYMIMEKLGYNLKTLMRRNTKHKFTVKTVV